MHGQRSVDSAWKHEELPSAVLADPCSCLQMQGLMVITILLCGVVVALHHFICQRFSGQADTPVPPGPALPAGRPACTQSSSDDGAAPAEHKPSVWESLRFLAKSPQIQCLGVMSMSQGLTTNLLDMAWKTHLHMLHNTPAAYAVRHLPGWPIAFEVKHALLLAAPVHRPVLKRCSTAGSLLP